MNKSESDRMSKTVSAVRAILKTNPDISNDTITDSVDVIVGIKKVIGYKEHGPKIERPYTRQEVAQLLGKNVRTIDYYARKGKIKKVRLSHSGRCVGFTAESVHAMTEGRGE